MGKNLIPFKSFHVLWQTNTQSTDNLQNNTSRKLRAVKTQPTSDPQGWLKPWQRIQKRATELKWMAAPKPVEKWVTNWVLVVSFSERNLRNNQNGLNGRQRCVWITFTICKCYTVVCFDELVRPNLTRWCTLVWVIVEFQSKHMCAKHLVWLAVYRIRTSAKTGSSHIMWWNQEGQRAIKYFLQTSARSKSVWRSRKVRKETDALVWWGVRSRA